ncbi:putative RING-H2 finger protein ATL69 [Phragmites australis]|uniref:putative RING-H2 finger protein ATL69 n=1 Tax=Phragmites australis TaxID=29695 RepID=UPI002D77718E|nr:putative RING-H2 finger protein ATL69 [Phragmites australis]XP_062219193.1 putative RING-H2 finger protein ATL69 [Phragmites australis]
MSPPADSKGGGIMGMNMVTTVMAFSVSAFFVLFVFTRLLCARLHLRVATTADHAAGDAFVVSTYHVEHGISGLEPSVVTSFPTFKLGDGPQRPPLQESQCTVCLEEYEAKDVVRVLPACGHTFHVLCIDAWLRQHPTCPVCRASLRTKKRGATPLDYGLLAAAPASQVPASSSDLAASPQATADQTGIGVDGRLEIVAEEPASSGDQSAAAAAAAGGNHSRCGETARHSASSASASEHC